MSEFYFNTSRSIIFGCGRLDGLGEVARASIPGKVLIVTDQGLIRTGIVERARHALEQCGIDSALFSEVMADPPEATIQKATDVARSESVSGIIGLGGGSSLDVAKLAALLAVGKEALSEIYGVGRAQGPRLPLVLIPTTAGTGSEVTPISIVTTGENEKMGVVSPVLLPDIAILDPELTSGLPASTTAATGIDAMVHAIEAYASASPNNNPISRALAEKALKLMGASILTAVQDGQDIDARSDMLLGSMLAGQAFANSPVAAVHALAYPLGGHFHVPHGLSNALVLPHVLRFNAETTPEPYAELASFVFPELGELGEQDRPLVFCDRLAQLSQECGLQQRLRELDIPQDALPKLADDAMNQTRLLVNNPRELDRDAALKIYEQAY